MIISFTGPQDPCLSYFKQGASYFKTLSSHIQIALKNGYVTSSHQVHFGLAFAINE